MNLQQDGRHPAVRALIDRIKSEGIFDALRKECLADADTKPAYVNLKQRVENYCSAFLAKQTWSPGLNKNQLREQLRTNLSESGMLQAGVKRIVNQVITSKIDTVFRPKVAKVVIDQLGVNPDELDQEEYGSEPLMFNSSMPPLPVSLFPFNPLVPPQPTTAPPPLPGFEHPPLPSPPPLPPPEEDMDISDQSDKEHGKLKPTKSACSETKGETGRGDSTDLSRGLAGYMADQDDMSISSGDKDDNSSTKDSETSTTTSASLLGKPKGKKTKDALTVKLSTSSVSNPMEAEKRSSPTATEPVVERRSSRRQRTRNKKYLSDDFTSIFTEKKELLGETYNETVVEEEVVTIDHMMFSHEVENSQAGEAAMQDETACGFPDEIPIQLSEEEQSRDAGSEVQSVGSRPDSAASSELRSSVIGIGAKEFRASAQRYDQSDLYKPRTTRRRSARHAGDEPPVLFELETVRKKRGPRKVLAKTNSLDSPVLTETPPPDLEDTAHSPNDLPNDKEEKSEFNVCHESEEETINQTVLQTEKVNIEQKADMELSSPVNSTGAVAQDDNVTNIIPLPPDEPPPCDEIPPLPEEEPTDVQYTYEHTAHTPLDEHNANVISYYSTLQDQSPLGDKFKENSFDDTKQTVEISRYKDSVRSPISPEIQEHSEGSYQVQKSSKQFPDEEQNPYNDQTHEEDVEQTLREEDDATQQEESEEEDEIDREELERLAQRKLEILKAIEMPDIPREKLPVREISSEEEGEIADSSSDEEVVKIRKSKSKKSKKYKKAKKESKKRKHRDDSSSYSKRSRYY